MARRAGAVLLALACAAAGAQAPVTGSRPSFAQSGRSEMLARAESALERGDAVGALDDFERAAMMLHAPDAEMGLIRAALQDGQYRRALAFAAHTAGGHLDAADAGALYAWLLRIGGQPALAERVLADTLARAPGEPVSTAVAAAFAAPLPVATGVVLEPPHRMAPWPAMRAGQAPMPISARLVSGAVLIGDGAVAVVPAQALTGLARTRLWVRNGLGETTEVSIERSNPALESAGIAVLRLAAPLKPGVAQAESLSEPFAGAPGYALQFANTSAPAWPWLRQGFFGGLDGSTGRRRLGFDAGGGTQGAPVLDGSGRLVGITLGDVGSPAAWLPATQWRSLMSPPLVAPANEPATPPAARSLAAPDMVYEAGLRIALQVLAADF